MKKSLLYLGFCGLVCSLSACTSTSEEASKELVEARDSIALLTKTIENLNGEINLLKFPANQRLAEVKRLISDEKFTDAKSKINELQRIFPKSEESQECESLLAVISEQEAKKKAEEERLKALGFKALKESSSATIGYNKVSFSGYSVGAKFIHDSYPTYSGTSWFEHTADRGNKYITYTMSVTSSSKDPDLPTLAVYSINGDKLSLEKLFWIQFARWDDYSSYLGNEPDLKNDFAKVSTVKFKLGCELSNSNLAQPYIIVLKKENSQTRNYDRFKNPPIWYSGDTGYAQTLTIEDFNGNYQAIKICNLK